LPAEKRSARSASRTAYRSVANTEPVSAYGATSAAWASIDAQSASS
jgi:hypothetical protein